MNRNRPYDDLIKHKLEHSAEADIDALWNDMNKVLDDKMPQQEEKDRRVLAWVFRAYLSVILISIGALSVTVYIKYKESKVTSNQESTTKSAPELNITTSNKNTVAKSKEITVVSKRIVVVKKLSSANKKTAPTSKSIVNKSNQREPKSVQSNISGNVTPTHVNHIQKKQISNINGINTKLIANKLTLNKNASYTVYKKKNSEMKATVNSYQINNPKNYLDIIDEPSIRIKSDPLSILGWNKVEVSILNVSDRSIVSTPPVQKIINKQKRGWVIGAAVTYNIPVSKQEMTTIDVNGKKNALIDYLPSLSAQFHFNNKLYLQTQFQFISPQYTPNVLLANKTTQQGWGKKSESFVTLNKLYYLNLPVSVHYSPKEHLYVGMGIQYSYLKKSILTNENCTWDWAPNGWVMTSDTKTVYVKSNPHKELSNANANSNGGSNGGGNGGNPNNQPAAPTQIDTVARSFRSNDWRLLADVNYQYHRFNLGASFNIGINKYFMQSTGTVNQKIADRNESVFIYLKYNFLDLRRKK